MKDIIALVIIPLVLCVLISFIWGMFSRERNRRKEAEQELQSTRKSLKELCEICIKENNNIHAKITYQAYFGSSVNHTGDGFIDGYE